MLFLGRRTLHFIHRKSKNLTHLALDSLLPPLNLCSDRYDRQHKKVYLIGNSIRTEHENPTGWNNAMIHTAVFP